MFHNWHNPKNYALINAKHTIIFIVGRLWKGAFWGQGCVVCCLLYFSHTPCGCTSFLSWPCRCISLYHHCKAFYFRFIVSFILLITSFTLHRHPKKKSLCFTCVGDKPCLPSPTCFLHFSFLFSWCKGNMFFQTVQWLISDIL